MLWLMQAVMRPLGALRLQQPFTLQCTQEGPREAEDTKVNADAPTFGFSCWCPTPGGTQLVPPSEDVG